MNNSYLCKNLKYLRKKHRFTQAALSAKIGVSRSTYAYNEIHGIPTKSLQKYSEFIFNEFGLTLDHIIKYDLQNEGHKATKEEQISVEIKNIESSLDKIKSILLLKSN